MIRIFFFFFCANEEPGKTVTEEMSREYHVSHGWFIFCCCFSF